MQMGYHACRIFLKSKAAIHRYLEDVLFFYLEIGVDFSFERIKSKFYAKNPYKGFLWRGYIH